MSEFESLYEPTPAALRHIEACYNALHIRNGSSFHRPTGSMRISDLIAVHEANISLVRHYVPTMRDPETVTRARWTVANLQAQIKVLRGSRAA